MTEYELFHHSPILSPREIRILCLRPGAGDDPLSALSYEWGSPERSEHILIDCERQRHYLQITNSLATALKDLRHQDEAEGERLIWADGICINQSDKAERQHQVFLMGSIYRKAWRVITYIGQSNENTLGAIKLMRHLWRAGTAAELGEASFITMPARDGSQCSEMRKMILSGWAGRVWCAQEFLLNSELVLSCGRHEIEWFRLPGVVQLAFNGDIPSELLPTHNEDPLALRESLVLLWSMRASIHGISTKRIFQLFELLCNTHPMRATDPRDKVFALLSLASDAKKLPIIVDYDCAVEQLYISVARALVDHHVSIEFLNSNLDAKQPKLPSWVPDWSCWRFGTGGMVVGSRQRASGYTLAQMSVGQGSSLSLAGCVIDNLEWVSDRVGPHFMSWDYETTARQRSTDVVTGNPSSSTCLTAKLPEWLGKYVVSARDHEPYHDGSTVKELLWCTLTCKTTADDEPADDSYVAYFDSYLAVCHRWTMAGTFEVTEEPAKEQRWLARSFFDTVRRRMRYRRLGGSTRRNLFGAVPEEARPGDKLCIIEGAGSWYVLREMATLGSFELVGPAYVHGFMNGEVTEQWYYKPTKICLV